MLVSKHLFNNLRDKNLLSSLQSGFLPGDSNVNQLTFLYNPFCPALDSDKEVRAVFFDIRKAFDRVRHAGLLTKPQAAGVSENVHTWLQTTSVKKQRVVLPGSVSGWTYNRVGVSNGSLLGPRLFLTL